MIIDFHTHTFPDPLAGRVIPRLASLGNTLPHSDGTNAGLTAHMACSGVDVSVILPVATAAAQVATINRTARQINESGRKHLLSFGGVHPEDPNWRQTLLELKAAGIPGFKLHPVYQQVDLDDIRFLRMLDFAGSLELIAVTHAGYDVGFPGARQAMPERIAAALEQVGPVTLVAAHMGGWRCWEQAQCLAAFPNVYLDTSYSLGAIQPYVPGSLAPGQRQLLSEDRFARLLELFGPERILFGSDSPWGHQAQTLALLRPLVCQADAWAAITGGNARRLLGL